MNTEVKEKWINALESGEYKQGDGYLKYYDRKSHRTRHCCLGVLCDIYEKENGKLNSCSPKEDDENDKFVHYYAYSRYDLPTQVMEWAELSTRVGSYGANNLSDDNDNGKTFKEIANIIRENF